MSDNEPRDHAMVAIEEAYQTREIALARLLAAHKMGPIQNATGSRLPEEL
jgi:hypothetical protein